MPRSLTVTEHHGQKSILFTFVGVSKIPKFYKLKHFLKKNTFEK